MQLEADPDPEWVIALTGRPPTAVGRALKEASADQRLFRHLAREHEREGRDSYIEIDAPLELYAVVRLLRPKHVVEIGVSSGVSSAYLLAGLRANGGGLLHSVDLPSRPKRSNGGRAPSRMSWSLPPDRDTGWAVPRPLRGSWDLRLGDKSNVLPLLGDQLPRIDLLVYDVPHDCDDIASELAALDAKLPDRSVVIVDHGPGGGMCPGLKRWAHGRGAVPVRRRELGLFGARALRGPPRARKRRVFSTPRTSAPAR